MRVFLTLCLLSIFSGSAFAAENPILEQLEGTYLRQTSFCDDDSAEQVDVFKPEIKNYQYVIEGDQLTMTFVFESDDPAMADYNGLQFESVYELSVLDGDGQPLLRATPTSSEHGQNEFQIRPTDDGLQSIFSPVEGDSEVCPESPAIHVMIQQQFF